MKNFIIHLKGVVTAEDCKEVICFFESRKDLQVSGCIGDNLLDSSGKKDTEIILEPHLLTTQFSYLGSALNEGIEFYKKQYPFVEEICSWGLKEIFKIQRYKPMEGYFSLHCENDGDGENISKRCLAWMIYLNDVKEGGHTEFPTQNKKFQPRRGDVLLWPAYFTHPHRGIVSKTQTKYIVTGWLSHK